jgi:putative cardiolipin synthase
LLEALHRAADRGVRVRLLLDDINTAGLDPLLAALDSHPNIEVRLFNPFRHRRWRILDYLTDFGRVNRRMHNKSFTADNQATIVGGRNVGDEYFGAGHDVLFVDVDALAIGPVVEAVSNDFERYWTSASAERVQAVVHAGGADAGSSVATAGSRVRQDPAAAAYLEAMRQSAFVRDLMSGCLELEWAPTVLLSDDPAKGLGRANDDSHIWHRLKALFGGSLRELSLISAYFVPRASGVDDLTTLVRGGAAVTVLTNSFEATDVAAVHAGYAKRRKPLLQAGVTLFEMKRAESARSGRGRWRSGSSHTSLHAKTFFDRARVFIGSLNFDPRSARLNTEMGLVIESPALARTIAEGVAARMRAHAYEVRLTDAGKLQWLEQAEPDDVVHDEEPGSKIWQRFAIFLLSLLPIEWLL